MGYPERMGRLVMKEGMYICIGGKLQGLIWIGSTGQWLLAHLKRFMGIDLFPKNRILHWVEFP